MPRERVQGRDVRRGQREVEHRRVLDLGEGKGNAEGEDGASDDDGGPPEGSGEDADDNGKTKGKGADVGFGKGKGKMGKGFGKIGGKGCFGKGKGKKGSEGPWAEGMDPVEAPAEFSEKGSNTWVKGQSTEAAGAKRGATVLGGGTWKRPRMEGVASAYIRTCASCSLSLSGQWVRSWRGEQRGPGEPAGAAKGHDGVSSAVAIDSAIYLGR